MSNEREHTGGCLCGAVRYRASGEPTEINICYCTQCRRQSGSPMSVFPTYPLDRFELLRGSPGSFRASDRATRQFCSVCGSALFWRRDGARELDIFLGSFDEPACLRKPESQIWTQHRIPWIPPMPEIRAFARTRQEGQGEA